MNRRNDTRSQGGLPPAHGLYSPDREHESCGVGFVAHVKGQRSHEIVSDAEHLLCRMDHRGARGAEEATGDGAGILTALPHEFLARVAREELGKDLPEPGEFSAGVVFLPNDSTQRQRCKEAMARICAEEGQHLVGWRPVPTHPEEAGIGPTALAAAPAIEQVFVAAGDGLGGDAFERQLYLIRKRASHLLRSDRSMSERKAFYVSSLSTKVLIYKGMLTPGQLMGFYPDLREADYKSHLAMVHSRFSTNTFPSWDRAQPNRFMCHNGEINTLRGNVNWMTARQGVAHSELFGDSIEKLFPVAEPDCSDSGTFDNVLEFLLMTGRTLQESVMMMIPEAWQKDALMPDNKRAFYEFHSCVMEPWDGPASIAFTDGHYIGAVLDRNGLRPSRYYLTHDDRVIMASEVGVLPVEPAMVKHKGRLEPGRMFLVDFVSGRLVPDDELKNEFADRQPYGEWLASERMTFEDLMSAAGGRGSEPVLSVTGVVESAPPPDESAARPTEQESPPIEFAASPAESAAPPTGSTAAPAGPGAAGPSARASAPPVEPVPGLNAATLLPRMQAFGYTVETMQFMLQPLVEQLRDPVGSMGNDSALACLSDQPRMLYDYFKQLFAQVTNPPIDSIREEVIMSLECYVGPEPNLLETTRRHAHRLRVRHPILDNEELAALRRMNHRGWRSRTIDITFPRDPSDRGMAGALERICAEAEAAIDEGYSIVVLSDRRTGEDRVPLSSLAACGAVHHHLVRRAKRTRIGIVLETGEAREVHHHCLLIGYGADAINPYLAFEALWDVREKGLLDPVKHPDDRSVVAAYRKGVAKGMLKVMAKMGISTLQSYKGAQIFEAVGLADEVIERCFAGTASRLQGVRLDVLEQESLRRHALGYPGKGRDRLAALPNPGEFHWRSRGERHGWDPVVISTLQQAARTRSGGAYAQFAEQANDEARANCTLRGLLRLKTGVAGPAVPLKEVESAREIVKRFCTGAMSFGSISAEAHESLAVAMNRIGGRSNTGEGGEDPQRYIPLPSGDSRRSAIKQVASGRFGVTIWYLTNSDELQIKMAQGAKPGEGGELPGRKVDETIARIRYSTPGVGLISPPPHHDIYSIEDLAQLIHDLKNSNPSARISVKLVSEVGVGTIAAGVAKAHSDHILISGDSGGTGASPLTSIKHAGLPWELGIAETHQTLVMNDLRSRVILQTDGGLKTGRDVVIAALLGAEEMGFSTGPLIALGCIMMRKCHLNTCPVGIATQDPVLREKFTGTPEHVVNYLFLVAEEARGLMAQLGFRRMDDMIGRVDVLQTRDAVDHWKADGLDLTPILTPAVKPHADVEVRCTIEQDHGLERALDQRLVKLSRDAIHHGRRVRLALPIVNTDRTVGTILSHEVVKARGEAALPDDTIHIKLDGSAGQSFGAFLARGITLELEGDSNDYVGKGLSGGRLIVYPPRQSTFVPEENVIIGNVALYGATGGRAFFRGRSAERFCVRNSGAEAVIEGVGDHGCEYMTGGRAVILGPTGRNFAAGMSGGVAYVWDPRSRFNTRCNTKTVEIESVEDPSDIEELRRLIEQHRKHTGSNVASRVLEDWPRVLTRFVKVMPTDYKRVLAERKRRDPAKISAVRMPPPLPLVAER